jgi:hypothetical protein
MVEPASDYLATVQQRRPESLTQRATPWASSILDLGIYVQDA